MPDDLLGPRPARPLQRRHAEAQARREEAKAAFAALPEAERDALWNRVDRIIDEATWISAKSPQYADNPHSYARRKDFERDDDFRFLVTFIRSGVCDRERFPDVPGGRWYDVLNRHHRKIWVMGWPLDYSNGHWCTTIINKKPVEPGDR